MALMNTHHWKHTLSCSLMYVQVSFELHSELFIGKKETVAKLSVGAQIQPYTKCYHTALILCPTQIPLSHSFCPSLYLCHLLHACTHTHTHTHTHAYTHTCVCVCTPTHKYTQICMNKWLCDMQECEGIPFRLSRAPSCHHHSNQAFLLKSSKKVFQIFIQFLQNLQLSENVV